jgi:hypothetical protein
MVDGTVRVIYDVVETRPIGRSIRDREPTEVGTASARYRARRIGLNECRAGRQTIASLKRGQQIDDLFRVSMRLTPARKDNGVSRNHKRCILRLGYGGASKNGCRRREAGRCGA